MEKAICKHCSQPIRSEDGRFWLHLSSLSRCNPERSGRPYGLNADPVGSACQVPCADAGVVPQPNAVLESIAVALAPHISLPERMTEWSEEMRLEYDAALDFTSGHEAATYVLARDIASDILDILNPNIN